MNRSTLAFRTGKGAQQDGMIPIEGGTITIDTNL